MKQDTYPYTKTWDSLTEQQKRYVKGRANRAKLPIPEILGLDIEAQRKRRAKNAKQAEEK